MSPSTIPSSRRERGAPRLPARSQSARAGSSAPRARANAADASGAAGALNASDVREDDGVGRGVRQAEGAAEDVAELVVQAHRGRAEDAPAEPRPVQRLRAGLEVGAVGGQGRQGSGERPRTLLGHQRGDRRGVGRVQALDRVRERVHAARRRQVGRHRERERGVVDDGDRLDARLAAGALHAVLRQAPDRRHLRAGVRRGHRDHRKCALERERPCRGRSPSHRRPPRSRRRRADAATSPARRATSTGTCIRASGSTATTRSPRRAATRRPSSWWDGPQITITRASPTASTSSAS